uniref:Pseudouridylate synthase RPUSD4, mitochondrial n=1 Tax=Scylla olivacea TaxID=85551 RepID=A0A0P4WHA9_SCYOL
MMWARAGTSLLTIERNCIPQRHHIVRNIKTQCANFHPRGYLRRDMADVSQTGDTRGGHVLSVSTASPVHRKDTRTIDSMDPVVLKYTNMINDMRSESSRVERIHETHFGSIRFDQENTPHLHGLFDQGCDPEAITAPAQHPAPRPHESGQGEVLAEGVDSVTGGSEDEVIMNGGAPRDDNYFDNCMIGDYISSTSGNLKSPPVEHMQGAIITDSKISVATSKDLSYIDEVFFKNSLENLEINKQPAIDYSDIKKDLEKAVLSGEKHVTSEESERILEHVTENVQQKHSNDKNIMRQRLNTTENGGAPRSAYDYVVRMRREEHNKQHGVAQKPGDGSNKSYRKILSLVSEKAKQKHTRYEVLKSLKRSILYNDNDIIGLYKPYGITMHGGSDSQYHVLTEFLPELAEHLKAEVLYPVHRLDATTTGVVLLARTPAMANTLKRMFKEHQLKKTYWAITKSVPGPMQGIIDIPVAEGMVDGRRRMVLKPDVKGLKSTTSESKLAITRFKVISKKDSAALVELYPMTGVKHQLRVHLAFGLSCPVLGDHKYSHVKKMAPQVLPGDILDKLKIKQSKVRHLPLFLHCKSIIVPEVVDGRNITIYAKIPAHFNKALTLLKLNRHHSQVKLDELMVSIP